MTGPRSRAAPRLVALFAVYLVLLVWTVLWKLQAPWVGGETMVKLVPFVATDDAGASAPVEVVANVGFFLPYGLYLGLLAPARRWWVAPSAVAGTSLALEVAQHVLAVGRSDSTDVIANTAGGLAGLGLLALARRTLGSRTQAVMTGACSVATALTLLVGALYLASPWHPVHVHDVGPLARVGLTSPAPVEPHLDHHVGAALVGARARVADPAQVPPNPVAEPFQGGRVDRARAVARAVCWLGSAA